MDKSSQKRDHPEEQDDNGHQNSPKGSEFDKTGLLSRKRRRRRRRRCGKQQNKRKREISTEDSNAHSGPSLETGEQQIVNPPDATTNDESRQSSPVPLNAGSATKPFPPEKTNLSDEKDNSTDEEHTRALKLSHRDDTRRLRSSSLETGNQQQVIPQNDPMNGGDEDSDFVEPRRPRLSILGHRLPDSSSEENASWNSSTDSSSSEAGEQDSGDEREGSDEESDELPSPNEYREEFRMEYRRIQRQTRNERIEIASRKARTKRAGRSIVQYRRAFPEVTEVWRLQYETGCLPGGPNEFEAPKRRDDTTYQSLEHAGSNGFELMAENLGYSEDEMKQLGGYEIEVDTDDRLEMAWCPPDSEYSRIIITKFPGNAGRWIVDAERGFKYDGSRPFEMPKWSTSGPFQTIEEAVIEAKKQVGADRGWEWEQVAMDGTFEIKKDNANGWVGHWNPPDHEYSHVSVKILDWPTPLPYITNGDRIEVPNCGWRTAFWVKRPGMEDSDEEMENRVEWFGRV